MTAEVTRPQLAPTIQTLLDALRRRIRRYVWIEGIATAAACLGLGFWVSLAVDWLFEPPAAARATILAIIWVVVVAVIFRLIVRRVVVPLRDRSMALLLEKYFPEFQDRLLTAVELSERDIEPEEADRDMLARTCREAVGPVSHVRLGRVFNPWPLARAVSAAVLLLASIVVFGLLAAHPMAVWARRTLLFSEEMWPRKSRLMVDGFDDGVVKVARGGEMDIKAKADLSMPEVPQLVEIRYRTEGGARDRKAMNREGNADPEKDQFQEYSYTFRSVLAPIVFDVFGGDDSVRNLRIEVVENPTAEMVLDCEYPKYMARDPRTVPASGLMQFPLGAKITVRAKANKALRRVVVDSALEDPPKPGQVAEPLADDPQSFRFVLPSLARDTTLLFTLYDTDGIKSRDPYRLTLAALEDKSPEFTVQLQGIGPAITPQASIPVTGRATDDNGIANIWFEYQVDKAKPARQMIQSPANNPTEVPLKEALDVRPLGLKPGQKFQLWLRGDDHYNLGAQPNIGQSDRWLLDVVTPDQLRNMLQARELVLRQRFEAVIQDVVDTRDLLARIDFDGSSRVKKTPSKAAEPGEKPDEADNSPQRLLAQRLLRVQSAMQNSVKDAHEVLGIAQAFDDIRAELVNNRIDTEELKIRLETRIADPLRRIGGEMFPELDRRLDELQTALEKPEAGRAGRDRAVGQVDAILAAMKQTLSQMLELEDFNEAVELLRSIIQSQEKVTDQTRQRQKQKLRDLLEK